MNALSHSVASFLFVSCTTCMRVCGKGLPGKAEIWHLAMVRVLGQRGIFKLIPSKYWLIIRGWSCYCSDGHFCRHRRRHDFAIDCTTWICLIIRRALWRRHQVSAGSNCSCWRWEQRIVRLHIIPIKPHKMFHILQLVHFLCVPPENSGSWR